MIQATKEESKMVNHQFIIMVLIALIFFLLGREQGQASAIDKANRRKLKYYQMQKMIREIAKEIPRRGAR